MICAVWSGSSVLAICIVHDSDAVWVNSKVHEQA